MEEKIKKYKILIIEDEKEFSELLKVRLESEGFTVLTAEDGYYGLELARKQKPDLIISDVVMPAVDGFHVNYTNGHRSDNVI